MNILKILSHTTWGSDRKCLMDLYKSLIRTRLDYGAVIYQSATPSTLKTLDPVHHLGIRLATGAFRTSPVESLYVEANEWSLHFQRSSSSFLYFIKVNADNNHPTYHAINNLSSSRIFHRRPALRAPFFLWVRSLAEQMGVPLLDHHLMEPAKQLPPWQWQLIHCDMSFVDVSKHAPSAHIRTHFLELQHKYSFPEFYTDASKSHSGVSYAAVGPSFSDMGAMSSLTSIFTAEAYAVLTAAQHLKKSKFPKAVIYTDSLSVVTALKTLKTLKNPVIVQLYKLLCTIYACKQHLVLCWVPGHRDIQGNQLADQLATSVHITSENTTMAVRALDMKPYIRKCLKMHWQHLWDTETNNKLHLIKPNLGKCIPSTKLRRKDVLLCRLRIGHTYGTHNYLLSGGQSPICSRCGEVLTVIHVLIECQELERERKRHFIKRYHENIPLHPSMFLGIDPIFNFDSVLDFLEDARTLQIIQARES